MTNCPSFLGTEIIQTDRDRWSLSFPARTFLCMVGLELSVEISGPGIEVLLATVLGESFQDPVGNKSVAVRGVPSGHSLGIVFQ